MFIELAQAVKLLKQGELVAFPTETVYGLGADATNELACQKVYQTKGRPSLNPLIVHVGSVDEARVYGEIDSRAELLAQALWPGPLTIVIKKRPSNLCKALNAGLSTIAIRIPQHSTALFLIKEVGPIAAPSANKSGRISTTTAQHVIKDFGSSISIIDGNRTVYGIESTIVDLSGAKPIILRPGFIDASIVSDILGESIDHFSNMHGADNSDHPLLSAPGMLKKHYAPDCYLRINALTAESNEVAINFGSSNIKGCRTFNLSITGDLIEAAANLYDLLQQAESLVQQQYLKGIAIASIPNTGIGLAINDKLERASSID